MHLFEPFFTTKGVGQGTGLGLATCFGIIKQSDGHITVESEPGRGSRFYIYLPRVESEVHQAGAIDTPFDLPRGTETILLVEDEPGVRNLSRRVLQRQGYTVLEASNGDEALRLVHELDGATIHLLVTDLVMPGLNGQELARRLKAIRPNLQVLFISGYTSQAIVQPGMPEIAFLPKPFTPERLIFKVRAILEQQ